MAHVIIEFENTGKLPAEFEDPEIEIGGVDDGNGNIVFPVMVEGYVADGIRDFEDLDGHVFPVGAGSLTPPEMFGLAFIWDEDIHIETGTDNPITFTVRFPYIIADIN
jgi:hypothetical protein